MRGERSPEAGQPAGAGTGEVRDRGSKKRPRRTLRSGRGSRTNSNTSRQIPARVIETDAEIVLLIEKIGATSIGEIEKLIRGMQEAKNFLQSEKERIQPETARYTKLAQTASASIEIIFDTVRGWREAGHPIDNQ